MNFKQKGQFMIAQLLKRKILPPISDSRYAEIIQYVVLLMGAVIFAGGILAMADMDLTREQLAVGYAIVFSMVLQCGVLAVLLKIAQRLFSKST